MTEKKSKSHYKNVFIVLVVLTILDLVIPDPLPLVDEIAFIIADVYYLNKMR